ncbi:MAG: UDP-3-O-(3-hydroxymyristoyl)glucosamine N-acyltransferase [Phycisphaera sp.]|nr:UDP-3-O-(3-hydroxymyristoyl)glucosamine N-acyltransferase [Phycisphaera sp.]
MKLSELAQRIGARLRGDSSLDIESCATLDSAQPGQVAFVANRKYVRRIAGSGASAIIVSPKDAAELKADETVSLLIADDPYFAFREAVVALHGWREQPAPGVSRLAYIDDTAVVHELCTIRPFAYIAPRATIGRRCIIYPNCYVGKGVTLGDDCVLYPGVTIYDNCKLGDRVVLHAGCVIGADGYGYATHAKPGEEARHHKIPQAGIVEIEDDVEIGANAAVDRAALGVTRVGKGTKIDNLVTVGHGAGIGKHNLLVAHVGIAGSTTTGDYVTLGGQVGVAGHLHIGDGAQVAAQSGVTHDLAGGEQYGGAPAIPMRQARRTFIAQAKMPEMLTELRSLRRRIDEIEKKLDDG